MELKKGNSLMIGSVVLAVGLMSLGWMIRSGIHHFKDSERVVSVKGVSEKEVTADRVIWPLVFKEVGDNLLTIYTSLESTNKKIVEFLKTNGVEESEITISPADIIDMEAERYVTPGIKYRYNVTSVLTVTTTKVDLVRQLMSRQSDLLKQGIAVTGGDYRYSTQFLYTGLNEIKPPMIEEATKSAREAAKKFAVDSKSKLGKIKFANQGQFTITDRDANTPYLKTVRVVTTVEYYLKD